MLGSEHLTLGTAVGAATAVVLLNHNTDVSGIQAALFCSSCMCGSLLPDIDCHTSNLGRRISILSRIITALFGHRGMLHTPLFGFIIASCIAMGGTYHYENDSCYIAAGLLFGYLCHLIQDSCTVAGIMWLWPVIRCKFRIMKLQSDSMECWPVTLIMIGIWTALCLFTPLPLLAAQHLVLYFIPFRYVLSKIESLHSVSDLLKLSHSRGIAMLTTHLLK